MQKKELKEDFKKLKESFPNLGTIICFGRWLFTQKGKLTQKEIRSLFNDLVEEGEYLKSEKESLLKWLFENHASDYKKD